MNVFAKESSRGINMHRKKLINPSFKDYSQVVRPLVKTGGRGYL